MKIYRACYKKVQGTCLLDCNQRRKWEKHSRRHYATPIQVIIVKSRENYITSCFASIVDSINNTFYVKCIRYKNRLLPFENHQEKSYFWKTGKVNVSIGNPFHISSTMTLTLCSSRQSRSSPSDELFSLVPPAVLAFEIFSPVSLIFSSF